MNKFVFVVLSVAFLASAFAVDVTISATFTATDSLATPNSVTLSAGASLTSVSFTAVPDDPSILINYPGSATQYNVGSISNGANGYGNFQVTSNPGWYQITVIVKYKKINTWYSYNQTFPLIVEGGDTTTYGKRADEKREEVEARQQPDLSIDPSDGWVQDDAINTWQSIRVTSLGPALSAVTFNIISSDNEVGVYYNERTSNALGNIPAYGTNSSDFQMVGNSGTYWVTVRINYRKSGVARSHSETLRVLITGGDNTTYGKRAVQSKIAAALPAEMNNMTVIGLAFAGIALIAIVAVVVVVAVVKRQRANIVA